MRWRALVVWLVTSTVILFGAPRAAQAGSKLEITTIVTPADSGGAALEKRLRTLLYRAAKPLKFGKTRVDASFRLTELSIVDEEDHVRITCTLVGRLKGGGAARSHISFGGARAKTKALERQVLLMVTEGVMGRLAQIARANEALADKGKADPGKTDKSQGGKRDSGKADNAKADKDAQKKASPRPSRRAMR